MLYEAIRQTRPKLHCFGHLHEGYGVQYMDWETESAGSVSRDPKVGRFASEDGRTLLANAAIMDEGEHKNNEPWIVRLDAGAYVIASSS